MCIFLSGSYPMAVDVLHSELPDGHHPLRRAWSAASRPWKLRRTTSRPSLDQPPRSERMPLRKALRINSIESAPDSLRQRASIHYLINDLEDLLEETISCLNRSRVSLEGTLVTIKSMN